MAKEIHEKYIDPPFTIEFAIMFLPTECLSAEIVQNTALLTNLHNKYKVAVTGPTTLSAYFLAEVKTEFNQFVEVLEMTHKKIQDAYNNFKKLLGPRKRMMQRKLKLVPETLITEEVE